MKKFYPFLFVDCIYVTICKEKVYGHLYSYGSAARKVMYTTNAIESVNSSLRKVTKKGHFPIRMLYARHSICGLWNCIRNGMAAL